MTSFQFLQKILPKLYSFLPYYFFWKRAFPPYHVFFEVTYRCNLRCNMCHYLEIIEDTESKRMFKNEMTAERVRQVLAGLPRFSLITFTGGEAFMKSDFREILEFAATRHKVHIITNGTLLTPDMVEFLIARRSRSFLGKGVFYLGVSLEGQEKLHDKVTGVPGSFAKTTQGLERLVAARDGGRYPLIHLTCVIGRENLMELVPLYEYAERLGVNVCNYVLKNPAEYYHVKDYDQEDRLHTPAPRVEEINPESLREQLNELVARSKRYKARLRFSPNYITVEEIVRYYCNQSDYRDYRCFVPWAKAAVTAYGDVFSCPHYRLGEVEKSSGKLPWNGERAAKFRQMLKEETIFPGCLGCCQSEYIGPTQTRVVTPLGVPAFKLKPAAEDEESALACKCHGT